MLRRAVASQPALSLIGRGPAAHSAAGPRSFRGQGVGTRSALQVQGARQGEVSEREGRRAAERPSGVRSSISPEVPQAGPTRRCSYTSPSSSRTRGPSAADNPFGVIRPTKSGNAARLLDFQRNIRTHRTAPYRRPSKAHAEKIAQHGCCRSPDQHRDVLSGRASGCAGMTVVAVERRSRFASKLAPTVRGRRAKGRCGGPESNTPRRAGRVRWSGGST